MEKQKSIDKGVKRSRPSREKVLEWKKKYVEIRPKELSNTATFRRIANEDPTPDRFWDFRTVRNNLKDQLPSGPVITLNSLAEFASFMENQLPLQQLLATCEEIAPLAEVGKLLSELVQNTILKNPQPDQGLFPVQQIIATCEARLPLAEVGKRSSIAVQNIIHGNPRPDQVLRLFSNLLEGGFPLDSRKS